MPATIDAARDEKISALAETMLNTDPELVKLARTDRATAFKRAIRMAAEKIPAGSGGSSSGSGGAPAGPITFTRERRAHVADEVLMLQPGEPLMITITKGPDGRPQFQRPARSPGGLRRSWT